MADIIGWIATAIMAAGSFGVAHKRVCGLWLVLAGNVLWATAGYMSGMWSLIGVSVLMGVLDAYGIVKWTSGKHET